MAKAKEAPPPEAGAVAGEVSPELAAKAQAEVTGARSAPRQAEVIGNVGDAPKRKRGRPPGSTNKARPRAVEPEPEEPEEENDPATPQDMEELVDLFNYMCVARKVPPVEEDLKREWSKKAAKVANKWGGSLPLQAELTLLVSTVVIFGPRAQLMLSEEHAQAVAAEEALKAEKEHNARVEKNAHKATTI